MRILSIVNTGVKGRDLYINTPGPVQDRLRSQRTLNLDRNLPVWPNNIGFSKTAGGPESWQLFTAYGGTQAYLAAPGAGPHPDNVWGNWPTNTDQSVRAFIDDIGNIHMSVASQMG